MAQGTLNPKAEGSNPSSPAIQDNKYHMLFIHKTVSLCDKCYRHIPGVVYEKDGQILLTKKCTCCDEPMTAVVETDPGFYYSLHHDDYLWFDQIMFEATDRCQLSCPHCYHMPDNKTQDRPVEEILSQIDKWPRTAHPLFAGAEATLRTDFVELCKEISGQGFESLDIITNGIRFANKQFARDSKEAGLKVVSVGLNHHTYQGKAVHKKQLEGVRNIIEQGFHIGYVGYTMQSLDEVPEILEEIEMMRGWGVPKFRLRCGSFIGRSNDQHRSYLSSTVKLIKGLLGDELQHKPGDDNPYHVGMDWKGSYMRLIQWPDVTNIDMEELVSGPWCQFYDGPATNFVHQVITRDAFKNMNMPMLDVAPKKYHFRSFRYSNSQKENHWKHDWKGPQEFTDFDWSWESEDHVPLAPEGKWL